VPFLGNRPAENYISYDVQHFTTSATTSYTLDHAVANENELRLVINNVVQQPGSSYAYSASGTSLTLTSATSATDTMYCVYLGKATSTVNPPSGSVGSSQLVATSVTTSKIATDAVTEAKIADDAVESEHLNDNVISGQTELATAPADTDEFLVSDAGTLKRIDYTHIKGLADTNTAIVKGWIKFNGTGSNSIDGSYNVSSLVDNNTGSYSVNWSGATGATGSNHCTAGGGDKGGYNNDERVNVFNSGNNQTGVESWRGSTATDFSPLCAMTFGDGS
jgi:hypothetical protein